MRYNLHTITMDLFFDNLKYLMKRNGHSAIDLARLLEVDNSTVFRYMKTEHVPTKSKKKISEIYNIPYDQLHTIDLSENISGKSDADLLKELNDVKEMYLAVNRENEALKAQIEILKKKFLNSLED